MAVFSIKFSNSHNSFTANSRGSAGNVNGTSALDMRGGGGTLSEDSSSIDKHVTSAIMSETEIISVIMAVIALVKLLCSR